MNGSDHEETQITPPSEGAGAESRMDATGRYRLGLPIGEGGMAVVYDGYDTHLHRSVAVKVLRHAFVADRDMRTRFFYEANLLAEMDHPGILPIFDTGDVPGEGPFYAMKRVHGVTLRTILLSRAKDGINDPGQVSRLLGILEKAGNTLAYAHGRGIVHRDMKPSNIMVDDYGIVVVLDWGLSKNLRPGSAEQAMATTQQGIVKGTPAYMAPEQASGDPDAIDCRADVFALGIMLYEILTGQSPFPGATSAEVLESIVDKDPVPPRKVNRRASRVLAAVCLKALCKDPAGRYPTAKEFTEDLRRFRDRLPTTAYRPRLRDRLRSWAARHPVKSTAMGMLAAVVIVLSVGVYGVNQVRSFIQGIVADAAAAVLQAVDSKTSEIDQQVLDLEKQRDALDNPNGREAMLINAQIEELRAVRKVYIRESHQLAAGVIGFVSAGDMGSLDKFQPNFARAIRESSIREAEDLIHVGEYYEAHFWIWTCLVRSAEMGWDEKQMARLLELRGEAEAKMREGKGADFPMPDWEQHDIGEMLRESLSEAGLLERVPAPLESRGGLWRADE